MKELTKKQNEILSFIKKFIVSHGYPPTTREIGAALGISSPATIHVHLSKLEQKGYIKKENSKNRALELLVNNEYEEKDENIVTGMIANMGCITGRAKILNSYEDISNVNIGDIIISTMTLPNYIAAMEKAKGFITDEGGITCHAAILSREFNVPCIVGTINATKVIKDNDLIELDANNGIVRILERNEK